MEMVYDLTDYIDRYRGYGISRDEFHNRYNHLPLNTAHDEISRLAKTSMDYKELLYSIELGFLEEVYNNSA